MASILALTHLYEVVSAALVADSTPCDSVFGWRMPAQHPESNRIAWIPGDPSGALGLTGPARNPGQWPRSLATLNELFTVVINGHDPDDPENELRQYEITRYLRDAWYRAVYRAAYGAFAVKYEQWITTRLERRHGTALKIVCEIQATVPDIPFSQIPPFADAPSDTAAHIAVSLLDVTEIDIIGSGPPPVVEDVVYLDDPVTYLGEQVSATL